MATEIPMISPHLDEFEIGPYYNDAATDMLLIESWNSVDVNGGRWLYKGTLCIIPSVSNIGDSVNKYIIVTATPGTSNGTITAVSTPPDVADRATIRLIGELVFVVDPGSETGQFPETPPWDGQDVIQYWKQHIRSTQYTHSIYSTNLDNLSLDLNEYDEAQIFNWDDASSSSMTYSSIVPFQYEYDGGRDLLYADSDAFQDWLNLSSVDPDISWLDLNDTDPISYSGKEGFFSRVNSGESGLDLYGTDAVASDLKHSLLDPSGPYTPIPYEIEASHDNRYWPNEAATGFTGPDSKTYYTIGDVRADEFALVDAPATNYWNGAEFAVLVTDFIDMWSADYFVLSAANTSTISSTTGELNVSAGTDVDIDAGNDVAIDAAGIGLTTINTGNITVDSDNNILLDAAADILIDADGGAGLYGANAEVGAVVDVTITAGQDVAIDAGQGVDIISGSAGYLNLDPVGVAELRINGNAGNTLADGGTNLFEKGIFVNDDSWSIITGAYFLDSGGSPIGPYKVMVKE